MPWKTHPNGARELVRPTKYEKHLMLYPSGGAPARAFTSLKTHPTQVVASKIEGSKSRQGPLKTDSLNGNK